MDLLDIDKRVDHFFSELDKRIDRVEKMINNFRVTNTTAFDTTQPPKALPVDPVI